MVITNNKLYVFFLSILLTACATSLDKSKPNHAVSDTPGSTEYHGPKARLAVIRFTNNTDNKQWYSDSIGDGLANQLSDALSASNYFITIDRKNLTGKLLPENVLAKADKSSQRRAKRIIRSNKIDLLVLGSILELSGNYSGVKTSGGLLSFQADAVITMDITLIDAKTFRVLSNSSFSNQAPATQRKTRLSSALSKWQGTGLDQALSEDIDDAVAFIAANAPTRFFHYDETGKSLSKQESQMRAKNREMQMLLNDLGYKAGTADGIIGPGTRKAISKFQRDQGLAVTGKLNPATKRALRKLAKNPS